MAVVVRTQAQIEQLSKDLALRGVPVRLSTPAEPIAKNQLGRAILDTASMIFGPVTRELIVGVLQSSLFALTSIQIRRLDRQLAHHFGMRVDAAWQECFELGVELDSFEARALNRLLEAVRQLRVQTPTSAHQLVSVIFELAPSSLANLSRSRSTVAQAVNRDLDAALRLFAAAIRFDAQDGHEVSQFVTEQLDQRVAEDAIYAQQLIDAALVTTPSNLSGQRFRYLALPRLQDGIWPNLKARSSMLGATALRSFLAGRSSSPTQQVRGELADELRLFYKSIGAAAEGILLSAMQGEEEQPSQFFTLIGSDPKLSDIHIDFDLRRYVGRLRYSLSRGDRSAAGVLALLALADVPGAHPQTWQGLLSSSTTEPIFGSDEQVLLSASSLDAFEKCPLHWFIQTFAVGKQSFQASIGTLLHKALELAKEPADIQSYVESNWHELEFELGWQERAQRQRAMEMSALLAQYLKDTGAAHSAEEGFELEVGRLRIRGKIDRIEQTESGLVIADLKTGKTLPEAASSKQLAIYQLAMIRKVGAENVSGAKLISIGTGKLKVLLQEKLREENLRELDAAFESFESATSASEISARFSTHCETDRDCSLLLREVVASA
jgi:RecB family exonuclease